MKTLTMFISCGGATAKQLENYPWDLLQTLPEDLYQIVLISSKKQAEWTSFHIDGIKKRTYDISGEDASCLHGLSLDDAILEDDSEFIMTLDLDCWPTKRNWSQGLFSLLLKNDIVGIGHTYSKPNEGETGLSRRIKNGFSYDVPHVACMLMKKSTFNQIGMSFISGDDTGLGIIEKAKDLKLKIATLKPIGCLVPEEVENPKWEFNRDHCVLYDGFMHYGGLCREISRGQISNMAEFKKQLQDPDFYKNVIKNLDKFLYTYRFDNEDAVSDVKANEILSGMVIYLQKNERLFRSERA